MMKNLVRFSFFLAFAVIVLGAYVRLSDAGLGCPDWPGCYGHVIVPSDPLVVEGINHVFPDQPIQHDKAWKEVAHRYLAGVFGLVILAIAILGHKHLPPNLYQLVSVILGLVILQSLLGMWTVTLLLQPVVVVAHLLGGLTILSLLFWVVLRQGRGTVTVSGAKWLKQLIPVGICVLVVQIALGGWTSSNYAALACPDLPTCRGEWWPASMNFKDGFNFGYGQGLNHEGGVLAADARIAIHVSHRLGALLSFFILGGIAIVALFEKARSLNIAGGLVLAILILQITLGVFNVLMQLPLVIAVLHNAVAALLMLSMINLLYQSQTRQALKQEE